MIAVSSKKFISNKEEYLDVAENEEVLTIDGKNMFHLIHNPIEETKERVYYEPDEDFYRSITMDEFIESALVMT